MANTNVTNTLSTLNGLFKEVYADSVRDLIPNGVKLQRDIKFVSKNKEIGNAYHAPVIVGGEHGFTFADPTTTGSAFDLNAALAGQVKDASVKSVELLLRSRLSYAAASRAAAGRNAFVDATEQVVRNMRTSMAKKLEIELLYGSASIGKVISTYVYTTLIETIIIEAAEFAPGIWSGAEGMYVQAYDAVTGGTLQNTGGATTWSSGSTKAMLITGVNIATRAITFTATHNEGVAAGDFLFFAGSYGNEMKGIHSILNQTTGDLFGITVTSYGLFKGSTYAVGSASLSFNGISAAVDAAVAKGLDEDATVYVNIKTWTDMLIDVNAKRSYDQSYNTGKATAGNNEIEFYSQNGKIKIVPSIYVKEGYAYLIVPSDWQRIGSTDITFNRPGNSESFFMDLQDNAGYELRAYTDQALFTDAPGRQVILSGIVNVYT